MTAILNIVTSLILVFLIFSIVVSGLQEWWAQFRGRRGLFLRIGMQRLIGDDAIFVRVLQHPLVGSLYRDRAARGKPPSYVDPSSFALAFADVMLRRAAGSATDATQSVAPPLTFDTLHDAVAKLRLQHSSAALAVLPIIESSQNDLGVALKGIEAWFSNGMDRVTGWYKADAQKRLFAWGFVVACLCNIDTIEIYQVLNRSPALSASLASVADGIVRNGSVGGVDVKNHGDAAFTPEEAKKVMEAVIAQAPPSLPIGYGCLNAVAKVEAAKPAASKPDPSKPEAGAAATQSAATKTADPDADAIKGAIVRCEAELHERVANASFGHVVLQLLGWVLTALAGVLGAPYWFGLLTKIVDIRGSGPRPQATTTAATTTTS